MIVDEGAVEDAVEVDGTKHDAEENAAANWAALFGMNEGLLEEEKEFGGNMEGERCNVMTFLPEKSCIIWVLFKLDTSEPLTFMLLNVWGEMQAHLPQQGNAQFLAHWHLPAQMGRAVGANCLNNAPW